ncbi:hypothetical protein PRIPAC_71452 [Pristionchus pacificus]|uniref:Uncharacterized protein n=1 Tax=Pristionchus pacificus TaxID=54126 RepID=A0A454XPQ2_PRIPA|nr:hypothetical protein PRIPAC_71452 [Pristionchus pacificus]|eukprot:PDM80763.1 hypothetical protein PRIPAC_35766 [Pristionchus pacificus]
MHRITAILLLALLSATIEAASLSRVTRHYESTEFIFAVFQKFPSNEDCIDFFQQDISVDWDIEEPTTLGTFTSYCDKYWCSDLHFRRFLCMEKVRARQLIL